MGKKQSIEEIVRIIQRLHAELGRVPLKMELMHHVSRYSIDTLGGIDSLIRAAGLEPMSHTEARLARHKELQISERALFNHNTTIIDQIDEFTHREIHSEKVTSSILIAGDTHFPFAHKPTLEYFLQFNKEMQPAHVIQVGDLFDMYAHSRFPRSQNVYTPKEEEAKGREMAEAFFKQIHTDNPKAKIYNMLGNHDIRPIKRTLETMPSMEHFVEAYMQKLMTFENVELVFDHREIFFIEGVGFHHGYLTNLGDHMAQALHNMVVGHTHKGGVVYRRVRNGTLWELNAGFMGDPESKALSYTPSKITNYTLGFGYIDRFGPRFIHK